MSRALARRDLPHPGAGDRAGLELGAAPTGQRVDAVVSRALRRRRAAAAADRHRRGRAQALDRALAVPRDGRAAGGRGVQSLTPLRRLDLLVRRARRWNGSPPVSLAGGAPSGQKGPRATGCARTYQVSLVSGAVRRAGAPPTGTDRSRPASHWGSRGLEQPPAFKPRRCLRNGSQRHTSPCSRLLPNRSDA